LPEEFAAKLGVRKTRWEITFDRALYARRGNCEMIDLDNFIFKYLLKKAKSYEFGGLTAAVKGSEDIDGSILCSYLKWQN
ncbi:hypothetical protein ACKI2C_51720, partial [Streptomyces brasiliscabiei]|uniref:hypothetical protein n=1 Tax=Streptomyces brasiliscabiei TaxID=2736302 RepID=UPI0038F73EF6